jgi:hypothetical protein
MRTLGIWRPKRDNTIKINPREAVFEGVDFIKLALGSVFNDKV